MSQIERQAEVQEQTRQLLEGPLKHIRAAALAAVLLPLASIAVSPAAAQNTCSGGAQIGDFVWSDTNHNGVQDAGEPGISGAVVSLTGPGIVGELVTGSDPTGFYSFVDLCSGSYTVAVQMPPDMEPSPANVGSDQTDSDGVEDGVGHTAVGFVIPDPLPAGYTDFSLDFGFFTPAVQQPGTGTPGYWKNHPEAWPVPSITIGGVTYSRDAAISWLEKPGSDKTITLFSSLVSARLNVIIGNNDSCVASTITAADSWMATYGPVGHKVAASSVAWKLGEPLHRLMDNYNNGMLCAPHRD